MTKSKTNIPIARSAAEIMTEKLADFHDRLPPMVVKELRQGLRAKAFVGVFLTLQAFLGLVMLFAISVGGSSDAGNVVSRIIFFFFSIAVLCIQPLRAINALHTEIKSGAIDLMVLTKLSARRIALGKWAAIMAQSLLIFVSIVPYLILRYFFGGMNLFAELLTMATILVASGCITAINVGVSANGAILLRSLLPLVAGAFLFFGTCGICLNNEFGEVIEWMSMEGAEAWAVYGSLLLGAMYLAWMLFSLAVSAIAPMAENHSTLNRLIALCVMAVVAGIMYLADAPEESYPAAMGFLAMPAIVFAFCEPEYLLPIVTRPFVKRGVIGRMLGTFLYPSASSGSFFGLGLIALIMAVTLVLIGDTNFSYKEILTVMNICCGSLVFSAVVLRLFRRKIENLQGVYIGILAGGFIVLGAVAAVCQSMNSEGAALLFCWIPQVNFFIMNDDRTLAFSASCAVLLIYSVTLLIIAMKDHAFVKRAVNEEMALLH